MSVLSLDDVVALNALIVTAVGLSFAFSGRKERGKTFLDISKAPPKAPPPPNAKKIAGRPYGAEALARLEAMEEEQAQLPSRRLHVAGTVATSVDPSAVRELNVFFNWNGHTWEAFEVLGIPAGSSRDIVVAAFHASRAKSPDSTPFFQAATDAILKHK